MAGPAYVPKVDPSLPTPDPAAVSVPKVGTGQPIFPGDAGPGGTAPVAPKPVTPFTPISNEQYNHMAIPGDLSLQVAPPPPAPVAPAVAPTKAVETPTVEVPAVNAAYKGQPTMKTMIANVLSKAGTPTADAKAGSSFNFADLLKGAGGKLGDFLQRWGMGLQGAPTGLTQGDIQRAQAFELQKTQVQSEVAARQMALDNQYQTARMQLQNQMNLANLPIEAKQQLQNQLAVLDANYQNDVKILPLKVQQEIAQLRVGQQMAGTNTPMNFWSGQ